MKDKSADGLRGLAALNVALSHFASAYMPRLLHGNFPQVFPRNDHPDWFFSFLSSPWATLCYNGRFPVIIFFVLSGYVLAMPYFRRDQESLKKRLLGRYFRLNGPIVAAILISYLFYSLHLYVNQSTATLSGSTWLNNYFPEGLSFFTMVKEALWYSIFYGQGSFIPPLWTLRYEFIGSIYLLLYYIFQPPRRPLLSATMALVIVWLLYKGNSVFILPMFFGSYLNTLTVPQRWNPALFLIGMYFGAFQYESIYYRFLPVITVWDEQTFYNLIGAILVVSAVINGFGRKVLESAWCGFLGRISFSLYLVHFVVLCSFSCWLYAVCPRTPGYLILNLIAYLGVSFGVAHLFTRLVDQPAINVSRRIGNYLYGKLGLGAKKEA